MTEMIEGISPLHIMKINVFKANANANWQTTKPVHPMYNRMIRKKYPILSRIPFLKLIVLREERYARPAHFDLIGSNRTYIKSVRCRSNAHLEQQVKETQERLDRFLANIQGKEFTIE